MAPLVLAISGASGAIYGKEIFDRLLHANVQLHLIITKTAGQILREELDLSVEYFRKPGVTIHPNDSYAAPVASGSYLTSGMVVAPCSMGCLGRIASGVSTDLVERVAEVHLKERRKIILVPRETPLSDIHLENMLRVSRAGAILLPAMPAFTHRPNTAGELATAIAGRVFDQLGIPHDFAPRYNG